MSARVDEMTADLAVEQTRAIEHVAIAERRPAVADARGFVILVVLWLASALSTAVGPTP